MAIGTYAELKTAMANWLHKTDLTDRIPEFIAMAESEMFDELRLVEMESRETITTSTTSRYISTPTRFLEMRRLHLTYSTVLWELDPLTPEQMSEIYKSSAGKPYKYCIMGNEIEFERLSDRAYSGEALIYQKPEALETTSTNAVLTRYPNLYLCKSMTYAEPYRVNDQRAPYWETKYMQLAKLANNAAESSRYTQGPIAMRRKAGTP